MPETKKIALGAAFAATLVSVVLLLHGQGRQWICTCGKVMLWTSEAWSANTSQHFLDPYSFTHLLHGLAFCGLLTLALPHLAWEWRLWLAVTLEAFWEVFENSRFVIERYRTATAALGYSGDTIINSLGDITACGLGFWLALKLGWRRSLILFVVVEIVLLVWIKDSFVLNIIMLLHPLESVKVWQNSGQ